MSAAAFYAVIILASVALGATLRDLARELRRTRLTHRQAPTYAGRHRAQVAS